MFDTFAVLLSERRSKAEQLRVVSGSNPLAPLVRTGQARAMTSPAAEAADASAPRIPAARVQNLTKDYGSGQALVRALDDVTLNIYAGEFTAVMGPSGSGKSTLMHLCAALDTATSGTVTVGDRSLSQLGDKELTRLRRDEIGFVFQSFNLVPTLTAEENILLPLSIAGRKPDREWYDTVIATVELGDRLAHKPNELSGGQQQRVAVARALVSRPRIVFADEPTGNLDSRSGAEVLTLLQQSVHQHGQTVVMVTHDPVAAAYTDRVVFLADGRVVDEMRDPDRDRVIEKMTHMSPEA
ncbi:ABC transporter ATP-binding protein [Nocardioides szechwanensis]|uniref:Putative ABC transport system ATP-binding protein n=2 Tax=Nocardioides szechwanensis TaxID=1005944 RepID=A0A1H0FJF6_9ACTN|nr:ABC transporter ATP-binding protein [Nocardioides szechwanensis]SDN94579.1 putative ABC transport system ATP-binding protein [Nocardioides szechwanensis]